MICNICGTVGVEHLNHCPKHHNKLRDKEIESLRAKVTQTELELAQHKQNAERYRWLLGESEFADLAGRWDKCYDEWDGSDGKAGFERVLDEAMKEVK